MRHYETWRGTERCNSAPDVGRVAALVYRNHFSKEERIIWDGRRAGHEWAARQPFHQGSATLDTQMVHIFSPLYTLISFGGCWHTLTCAKCLKIQNMKKKIYIFRLRSALWWVSDWAHTGPDHSTSLYSVLDNIFLFRMQHSRNSKILSLIFKLNLHDS